MSKPRKDKRVLENVLLFICFGVLGSWERLHSYKFSIFSIEFLLPGYGICGPAGETDQCDRIENPWMGMNGMKELHLDDNQKV